MRARGWSMRSDARPSPPPPLPFLHRGWGRVVRAHSPPPPRPKRIACVSPFSNAFLCWSAVAFIVCSRSPKYVATHLTASRSPTYRCSSVLHRDSVVRYPCQNGCQPESTWSAPLALCTQYICAGMHRIRKFCTFAKSLIAVAPAGCSSPES